MYRLITTCAVSLLLLGCKSAQQMADRQAAEARELNWQRKYVQERAEAAAVANQKADKPAANAAPRPEMHPESPQHTPAVPGSVETHNN
jgi:outer membrane murein-binding lipoprotein Lpp